MSTAHDVLFVMDPPETFNPRADSTFVMITEALRRGHRPWGTGLPWLGMRGHEAIARVAPLALVDDNPPRLAYAEAPRSRLLSEFSAVLMRKDPPVDQGYVAATWILDHAGTQVLNAPAGLRTLNEKLSILRFGDFVPRTFISRDTTELRGILDALGGRMIVKPVYGFGGREILLARADDPNLGSLLELATAEGSRWTVAQEYLPAAAEGDKRILLVGGEPIGAVLRVPAEGELRNNFHAGGRPVITELTDRDRAICSAVGPMLREADQFFVGIDVIGGHLTEINVTSPTGMQEINRLQQLSGDATMQARFWDALEARLGTGPTHA
jgi:glutathione synthase